MSDKRHRCPSKDCKWEGTEDDMEADHTEYLPSSEELWSNWICPSCKGWYQLEDYEDT